MEIRTWVRLPSGWIDNGGLGQLSWEHGGVGSDNIAALMVLTAISHTADQERGVARLTYDDLCASTGLSRAKIANGLATLKRIRVIDDGPDGARSTYYLTNFAPNHHWAKFPAKSMYTAAKRIAAYADFQLRRPVELDALKLFFLFIARRSRDTNLAKIGFEKIEQYTTIKRNRIKPAVSFLASLSLVYVEHIPSSTNAKGIANAYRIVGLDTYNHMGTRGRAMQEFDYEASSMEGGPTRGQPTATDPDYKTFLS